MKKIISTIALLPVIAFAQGAIENPTANSTESGIGIISGWHCKATKVYASIDDNSIGGVFVGSERPDTKSICGKTATGYSLLINFNNFSIGSHNLKMYADGVVFGNFAFNTVKSGGVDYLQGVSKEVTMSDFPKSGQTATLKWVESKQNFIITKIAGSAVVTPPATPPATGLAKLYGLVTLNYKFSGSSNLYTDSFRASSLNLSNDSLQGVLVSNTNKEFYCAKSGLTAYEFFCIIGSPTEGADAFLINIDSNSFISGNYRYCPPPIDSSNAELCGYFLSTAPSGTVTGTVNKSKSGGDYIENTLSTKEIANLKNIDHSTYMNKSADENIPITAEDSAKINTIIEGIKKLSR